MKGTVTSAALLPDRQLDVNNTRLPWPPGGRVGGCGGWGSIGMSLSCSAGFVFLHALSSYFMPSLEPPCICVPFPERLASHRQILMIRVLYLHNITRGQSISWHWHEAEQCWVCSAQAVSGPKGHICILGSSDLLYPCVHLYTLNLKHIELFSNALVWGSDVSLFVYLFIWIIWIIYLDSLLNIFLNIFI